MIDLRLAARLRLVILITKATQRTIRLHPEKGTVLNLSAPSAAHTLARIPG